MSRVDSADKNDIERRQFGKETPISISRDDARRGPTDKQMLYFLGFGIAGAILANITFVYFAAFHASG
jgi:hypothetical protein